MKIFNILGFIFHAGIIAITGSSQNSIVDIQSQIDEQVWSVFTQAYREYDYEKFNALHTQDVIRVTPRSIRIGDEYKASNKQNFLSNRESGTKRSIELKFEHRKTKREISYEVGYYRVTVESNNEIRQYFGRFHVLLKKIDGKWKITKDWDTDQVNGTPVTEEDFIKVKLQE